MNARIDDMALDAHQADVDRQDDEDMAYQAMRKRLSQEASAELKLSFLDGLQGSSKEVPSPQKYPDGPRLDHQPIRDALCEVVMSQDEEADRRLMALLSDSTCSLVIAWKERMATAYSDLYLERMIDCMERHARRYVA